MYSSAPHRVNVIAGPEPEQDAARPQADTPEMRRLAALFNAHRDAVCSAEDQEAEQETAFDAAAGQEQAEARQGQPDPAAMAAAMAARMRPDDASATPSGPADADAGPDTAAAQGDANPAGLPFAPVWQKPEQNGSGNGDNPGGHHGHSGGSGGSAQSGGQPPTPVPLTGRRAAPPASANVPANLIAALRAATGAPGFTGARTAQQAGQAQPAAPTPAQPAKPAQPRHARVDAAPAALSIGALNQGAQPDPLIDSIVSSVADFCANPAVFSASPWQLTVPLDPALLPGTQLTLVLSHFALTLRFATTEPASQDLILQHADALRQSLEALPTLHQDTPRAIEIVVT